jgi:hypothetical protein
VPVFAPDGQVMHWVATRGSYPEWEQLDRVLVAIAVAAQRCRGEDNPAAVAQLLEGIAATAERGLLGLRESLGELSRLETARRS